MKRIILTLLALALASFVLESAPQTDIKQQYINRFSPVAVREMLRSGIPASITLAQGLVESGAGQSVLAVKGNNHFGIKCHKEWTGPTMNWDDDAKGECFRVYSDPEKSYEDHTDFLTSRERYAFLFTSLSPKDYKGWANGLKSAGYATDPGYPKKLIKVIEDYNLSRFDFMQEVPSSAVDGASRKGVDYNGAYSIEASAEAGYKEKLEFSLSSPVYKINGIPCVIALQDQTLESIALEFGITVGELRKFNGLHKGSQLEAGQVVFLRKLKKNEKKAFEESVGQ